MERLFDYFEGWNTTESHYALLGLGIAYLLGIITRWLLYAGRNSRRKKELGVLTSKHQGLVTEHASLTENYNLRDADIQKANLEIEELNTQIQANTTQSAEYRAEVLRLKDLNIKLQTDNETYLKKIDMLDSQLINLQTQNVQLNEEIEQNGSTMENLNSLQNTYDTTVERISNLENRIGQLAISNENLKKENEKYLSSVDRLGTELNTLKEQGALGVNATPQGIMGGDNADYENRMSSLEKRLAGLAGDNASLKAELSDMRLNALSPSSDSRVEIINLKKDKTTQSTALDALNAKVSIREKIGNDINKVEEKDKDDLTKINGIGPFIQDKLNDLGIYSYEQICAWDKETSDQITVAIEFFPGRIAKDDWVGQACKLAKGKGTAASVVKTTRIEKATIKKSTDLKVIEGIGPKIEKILHDGGINDWAKLAATEVSAIKKMLEAAGGRYRLAVPDTWPKQSKLAADGKWTELKEYQDRLDGGREK